MRSAIGSAACAALLAGALILLAACGPTVISARPTVAGRFAYLIQTTAVGPDGSPGTQVRLARITQGLKPPLFGRPPDPVAADVATLVDTAAKASPTQVNLLAVSPKNTRLLVYSSETPINTLDQNLQVWNIATGAGGALFNEHSASNAMNKSACPSAVFKQYVDANYAGAPPAVVAALDYKLSVEGMDGANIAAPQILGWIDEQKLALTWKLRFNVTDGTSLEDTFGLVLTWPTSGPPTLACAAAPAIPKPDTVLTADPTNRLRGKAVRFGLAPRSALRIAGIIYP
jgi:hypothetical protein